MVPDNKKISIVMPAYNEERHIYNNILETRQCFIDAGSLFEIIIVDDGSSDQTLSQAKMVMEKNPEVKVISLSRNMGKGWALREGVSHVTGDYVAFIDSDLDLHPRQLSLFFEIMQAENADVVIGSKRHPDSKLNYPNNRKFISNGYFFLVKYLFGLPIKDTQTGLKLFKTEVIKKVFPRILVKRYAFDLEVLAVSNHDGFKIAEAPIVLEHHLKYGRIGFKAIWETWWDTMAVFYRLKILKYYDR